jgi:cytidine deaminase
MSKRNTLTRNERERLVEVAALAKVNAYSPYSQFRVGAALLTEDYTIFAGCNVENSSYGLTICAERNAVFKAVCAGQKSYRAIAIVSDDSNLITPCRQVLAEFAPNIELILANGKGQTKSMRLSKIFPQPPDLKKLGKHSVVKK